MKAFLTIIHLILAVILLTGPSCSSVSVNESIYIEDDSEISNNLTSVNGNIIIGENCRIAGNCRSVNGRIEVGDNSEIRTLQSVNGRIDIGQSVEGRDDISAINGSIEVGTDCRIEGEISTVNGNITMTGSIAERNIETVNGNILLQDRSELMGNIIISKGDEQTRTVKIELLNGSIIHGNIKVDNPEREVVIYKSEDSQIKGEISNARLMN